MSKVEDSILSIHLVGTHPSGNSDLDMVGIEYDPTGMPNSQNAINKAQRENLNVVFPTRYELFVDLDNEHSWLLFEKQFELFHKFIDEDAIYTYAPSKSGLPKMHVTVSLSQPVRDEEQRILFQALLGSDRVRELLGYVQAQNDDPHPTLFLEAKPKMLASGAVFEDGDILTDDDLPF